MPIKSMLNSLLLGLGGLALTACTSIAPGSPDRDAQAKQFASKSELGQLYVCRSGRLLGAALRPDVVFDGQLMTALPTSSYAYVTAPAGPHVVTASMPAHDSKLPFVLTAGELRYFSVSMSFGGVAILDELDPIAGKACVRDAQLVGA